MPEARLIFFGSDAICLPALKYLNGLSEKGIHLHALVSQPDRPSGRGKQLQANPAAAWAREQGVALLQPEKPASELAEWIKTEGVHLSLVMAYGHFLPRSVREAAPRGMVNFHGSILPAYRGASPVETALASGDTQTGVSLMEVGAEMDAGGVADLEPVCIDKSDTALRLRARVGEAVIPLLERKLEALLAGDCSFVPQDLDAVTYCRKICKSDGAMDFELTAAQLDCRLRAFDGWPGAYFEYAGTRIKVGRAEVLPSSGSAEAGTIVSADEGGLAVATGSGVLKLHELQRPGGRMLPAGEFLRGFPIEAGAELVGAQSEPLVRTEA
jgi:methionyl-tRNA formyltransferase